MNKNIIKFDETEIEEYEFHQYKNPILIINIDINKLVVSSKLSFCKQDFRYFIGYIEDKKNRPLCIFLSKTSEYIKDFVKNKCTSCLIKGEEFSKSIMKL